MVRSGLLLHLVATDVAVLVVARSVGRRRSSSWRPSPPRDLHRRPPGRPELPVAVALPRHRDQPADRRGSEPMGLPPSGSSRRRSPAAVACRGWRPRRWRSRDGRRARAATRADCFPG
jgi:hypothetical protein